MAKKLKKLITEKNMEIDELKEKLDCLFDIYAHDYEEGDYNTCAKCGLHESESIHYGILLLEDDND